VSLPGGVIAADADWGPADLDALQVPEPSALGMLAAGIFGLGGLFRRRS
jgi:hypothetical protein